MKFFINIIAILFFVILFVLFYFLIERSKKSDYITRRKYPKLLIESLEGVFYTIFGLLFQLFFYQTNQFLQPYFYISIGLTLIFLRGAFVSCISIIGSMLYSMFFYPIDKVFYYIIIIMFVSMVLTVTIKPFTKEKFSLLINIIFLIVNIIILWSISATQLDYDFTGQFVLATLLPFLLPIILIVIISYLLKFLRSANLLYESSTYDTLRFYRESISTNVIEDLIATKKVSRALFVILEMNWSKELGILERDFEKKVLKILQNNISKNVALLKINSTQYGFFSPTKEKIDLKEIIKENQNIKRTQNDSFMNVEKLLKLMEGTYTIEQKTSTLKMRAGVVVYGLQEQAILKMQSQAEFALEYSRWHKNWNKVILFDPNIYKKKAADYRAVKTLDDSIGILSISNEFVPIYSLKNKKTVLNLAIPTTIDELSVKYSSLEEYAEYLGNKNVLLSYNAAQAIKISKGWNKSPLIIYYPLEKIINKDFNFEELVASIRRFNQKKSNVILSFDFRSIGKFKTSELINLSRKLKQQKINFAIFNFKIDEKTQLITKLNPKYIIIDKRIYHSTTSWKLNADLIKELIKLAKVIKSKIIMHNIEKEEELKSILSTSIDFIGGPIFNNAEIEPTIFDEKSIIYIEQMKKEKKNV